MSDTVLTYVEACAMLGCRPAWLRRLIQRGDLRRMPTGRRLPTGQAERGISRASIEIYMAGGRGGQSNPATRTGKAEMRAEGTPASARGEEAAEKPVAAPAPTPPMQLALTLARTPAHLPITRDGAPDVAGMRAAGMGPAVDRWDQRMAAIAIAESRLVGAKHGEHRAIVRRIADEHAVAPSTLYRWVARKRDGGAASLVPAPRRRGTRAIPPELQPQILEFYLDQRKPSYEQVYAHVVVPYFAGDGRACPHITTVRAFIQQNVLPVAETAFREGPRALEAQMMPKVLRDWRTAGVNGWWVGDHRRWDVHIRWPDGKVRRPWVSMVTDVFSGGIVGWRICERPSAATVCHALREAILMFGPPANFLRDNGKEFLATRLGGKPERLLRPRAGDLGGAHRWPAAMGNQVERSGIWATLGVTLHTAIPYHAWSKPIESIFHAFAASWENLVPGWCGRSTERKPEQLKRQVRDDLLMLPDEFSDVFADRVRWWMTEHIVGDRPCPPLDMYKDHHPVIPDASTLAYLCQAERDARVEPEGIRLSGRYYRGEYLGIYTGAMLPVRWDPESPDHAYAYAPDGQVILLTPTAVAEWGDPGEALVLAKREGKRIRDYLAMIRARIRGSTPLELLDPLGAYQMVATRKGDEARAAQVAAAAGAADQGAKAQVTAREEATEEPEDEGPNIYEQAMQEEDEK